uniref:N5-glutamine methyltransferase family protein n=1 Tax=Paenibacillus sp. FSL W8-1187 TaxID=2975339 RepID=UPI00403F137D
MEHRELKDAAEGAALREEMESAREYRLPAAATIAEAKRHAAGYLAERGVDEPEDNVSLLLQHVLGRSRTELMLGAREPFPADREAAWTDAIRRKGRGEPAQYIAGEQWFYGRAFAVSSAVLIPRPETELLVEAVLQAADRLWPEAKGSARAAEHPPASGQNGAAAGTGGEAGSAAHGAARAVPPAGPIALDVGTGSGAIALTLASERPGWQVYASDLSAAALAVARANAERLGAPARGFAEGDLLAPVLPGSGSPFEGLAVDILVSNPPYIPAADLAGLQPEVRDYEPRLALDGGADGLDPYRRMAEQLRGMASLPRIVAFELGIGQSRQVAGLLEAFGWWDDIRIVTDYGGIERHVVAARTR